MATEALQKQTSAALTFAHRPAEFLKQLEAFLLTMQEAYRSKLSETEQQLWIRALTQGQEKFSIQEMVAALDEMVKNPPLYHVEGSEGPVTQKWRGMPKLPDLIETMLTLRERKFAEAAKIRQQEQDAEQQQLERRRKEHPELFMGWNEFVNRVKQEQPELLASATPDREGTLTPMAMEPRESAVLMNDEARSRRLNEMKQKFAEHERNKA